MKVVEVNRPMLLQRGTVYIGRGDADVVISSRPSGLHAMPVPAQRDYPWHPSVERMVRSALDNYDSNTQKPNQGAHNINVLLIVFVGARQQIRLIMLVERESEAIVGVAAALSSSPSTIPT